MVVNFIYSRNEMVRQDLREDQRGVNLQLDIGVMDTTTCTPLTGAFVELWNANATGFYGVSKSDYTTQSLY
jgi:protocatechuate 3,4-dioxygenase beta subunit